MAIDYLTSAVLVTNMKEAEIDNQIQQSSTQDSQPFSSSGSKEVEFDDLPF